jgi:hypothetical protein
MSGSMPHLDMEYVMRRVVSLSVLGLAAGLLGGCHLKEVYPTAIPPLAGVRFINAVPDTGGVFGMDLRFVDLLESNAHFRHAFRSGPSTAGSVTAASLVQYKHTRAGQRNFKIFLDDTLMSIATVEIIDTTVTLEAGKNYTALLWGYANPTGPGRPAGAPAMRLTFFEETVAAPGTSVAVRVMNATAYPLNVEHYTTATPSGTPSYTNMLPLSMTTHVNTTTGARRWAAAPTAGGATVYYGADPQTLLGAPTSASVPGNTQHDLEAIPGTNVAGSAVTMIIVPQSIRGLARTAQHTNAVVTGRRAGSVTDLGGGVWRITDCFVTANCVFPPGAAALTNPNMQVGGCTPDIFGDCRMTLNPPAASGLPSITVPVSTNASGSVDTTTDLTAYVGAWNALGVTFSYSVVGMHSAGITVWDRRPPYIR